MAEAYVPVSWNKQKKVYDRIILGFILAYLLIFVGLQFAFHPTSSLETLIIRATGSLAFLFLHLILCIGPLCRLNKAFLPLLYNRRHLGVTMFLLALVHGIFNIIQFHALGNADPLVSVFTANMQYDSFVNFPFQTLGFFALLILFLMAATSHDFWLKNLSPRVWKMLHMMVYVAYSLILFHVLLGVMQLEYSLAWVIPLGFGMVVIASLHLGAAWAEKKRALLLDQINEDGFVSVCLVDDIPEDRAIIATVAQENIAIFKYEGKVSAVSNICRHQNGPLGEGKIVDGCITCPWHGYQYYPGNGQSPPPFTEKLATYDVKIFNQTVFVNPAPHPEGTPRPPALIANS